MAYLQANLREKENKQTKKEKENRNVCSSVPTVCAQTITLFLFPELRVLELLVILEHIQHYSGQDKER